MSDDKFIAFAAGVQAMRRKCEGIGLGMGGALGVAAEPYPFQIATIKRVLSDTRIRHLICDEVGMGKTVQALMVLNALRCQKPGHRAVILAPPRLMNQWHEECWTRAHVKASVFDGNENFRDEFVRIVNPQAILARGDESEAGFQTFNLNPDYFDLLIVDEPQLMPIEVMETVQRVSASFRQVILLSASPGLGDRNSRNRLLSILEPERIKLAESIGQDVDSYAESLELAACQHIRNGDQDGAVAFQLFSRSRKIARSTRKEWRKFFPERRYHHIVTEPTDADVKRLKYGLEWLDSDGLDKDRWSAFQRLHRGARSVRPFLSGFDLANSRSGLLALEQCDEGPGDSRLDSLLDVLRTIWAKNPDEQIVVVAGDNPTIDSVSRNIKKYFDTDEVEIGISTLRRQSGTAKTEVEDIAEMQEAMTRFSAGTDRVLFVGAWVQAGLNLHYYARNMIFYNLPWDMHTVDQLIGRLDRLRPNGLYKGEAGRHFGHIRIWAIAHPGTPESRVLDGLEKLGVFRQPIPPLSPSFDLDIRQCIEQLADGKQVNQSLKKLEDIGLTIHENSDLSRLDEYSPNIPALALQKYEDLQNSELPEPIISSVSSQTYTQKSERALAGWLEYLKRSKLFDLSKRSEKKDTDISFRTVWYNQPARKMNPPIRLSEMPAENWMSDHVPFVCMLKELQSPPRMTVHTDEGEPDGRPLRFLSYGDAVHDGLVSETIKVARSLTSGGAETVQTIRFDPENQAASQFRGKTVIVSAALADPAVSALPGNIFKQFRDEADLFFDKALGQAQKDRIAQLINQTQEWWNSDRRWLNFQLEPIFSLSGYYLDSETWKSMPSGALGALLTADTERKGSRFPKAYGNPSIIHQKLVLDATAKLRREHVARAYARWQSQAASLEQSTSSRLIVVRAEQDDLEKIMALDVERAEARTNVQNERQKTMMEGQLAAARNIFNLANIAMNARIEWLEGIAARIEMVDVDHLGELLFKPVPYQDF